MSTINPLIQEPSTELPYYLRRETGDPFPIVTEGQVPARVLEVKDGWVLYELGCFKNQRKPIERFNAIYEAGPKLEIPF